MGSLAKPTHLEISIDEWQAAQEKVGAVNVRVSWRGARNDPILTAVFDGLPSSTLFVRGFPPPVYWNSFPSSYSMEESS
jgi:hypothetical protein